MKFILTILSYPFTWGLIVGLIFAGWALHSWWSVRRRLLDEKKERAAETAKHEEKLKRQENEKETTIQNVNMSFAKQIQELERECDELKKENETLRIKVQALENEPSHTDHLKFEQQEKAVALLQEYVPGFAQCWQKALRAAKNEDDKTTIPTFIDEMATIFGPSSPVLLPGNTSDATDTPA